ncbi:MAG: mechanosensitive ion channel [Candidatus Aenigmarchaeota archaeon]|nr:mechanosensitive ion channel [Candidatus Aenigmarchaeota archaeon]
MAFEIEGILQAAYVWFVSFLEGFLPKYILPNLQMIIQIVVVLLIGYILGKAGKAIAKKILNVAGLKRITSKSLTEDILRITGYKGNIVELIGDLVKWCIYIITLAIVVQFLGFTTVSLIFNQILMIVPRFIVAILVIVVGFIIADFFGKIFEEAASKTFKEETLSKFSGGLIKYTISMIAIVISLSLIGLDTSAIVILFGAILVVVIIIVTFGMKDLIPNFTAGLSLRKDIRVGDRIKIKNCSGKVAAFGPYSVEIRNGRKSYRIPNSILYNEITEKDKT